MKSRFAGWLLIAPFALFLFPSLASAAAPEPASISIRRVVDADVRPMLRRYNIPGMAVGVIVNGQPYVFNYGLADLKPAQPVTRNTLFELGSVSKTFTATLASYAQVSGALSLNDPAAKYLPSLRGTRFGRVTLLNLGTHTPGGLPLQVPDNIHTDAQLMRYFRAWHPSCPVGTCRTYTNIGIGALGLITAKAMHGNFAALMRRNVFQPLGLTNTFLVIPQSSMSNYAQGYTSHGSPIRMAPGELSMEAYGVRSTAADMLRVLQANMGLAHLNPELQRAITDTHTGYFHAGPITQDLIWEQYPHPVSLTSLLAGNSSTMAFDATPATKISPPQKPLQAAWINKTGSTNGFAAYVAFVPGRRLGIVILANKNYPIDARVTAAYHILSSLASIR